MNHEQQAFLDHLEKHPDDNAARLAFSDWLDEHDQPEEADRMRKWRAAKEWLTALAGRLGQTCINYDEYTSAAFDHYRRRQFGPQQELTVQEQWVEITFDDVIKAGNDYVEHGNWWTQQGSETARDLMLDEPETRRLFWEHWQIITGKRLSDAEREPWDKEEYPSPFSCSC